MNKYAPLYGFLEDSRLEAVRLTFQQIEALVGELPHSAYKYREWWANEGEQGRHVQSHAWLGAGYIVDSVNLSGENVVFRRLDGDAAWQR